MYDNPATNFGFMFSLFTEETYRCMKFCSSDHPTASMRPKLEITYSGTPIPQLELGNDIVQCGGSVTLNAGSGFEQYLWNGVAGEATFSVTSSGTYSVSVQTTDGQWLEDEIQVTIVTPPNAGFLVANSTDTPGSICLGDEVVFNLEGFEGNQHFEFRTINESGVVSGWQTIDLFSNSLIWQTSACIPNQTYQFRSVSITEAPCNGSYSNLISIYVSDLPQINLGNDIYICENLIAVISPGNGYASYAWSTSETTPSISVSQTGIYSVTVTNMSGCLASDEVSVAVTQIPELVLYSMNESYSGAGDGIVFAVVSGYAGQVNYDWGLGINSPIVTGLTVGEYCVRVSDDAGCSVSDCIEILPSQSQQDSTVAFYVQERMGCASFEVCFTDMSLVSLTTWLWDFGDGTTSTEQNPCHVYEQPGVYSVTLSLADDFDMLTSTYSNYIFVFSGPEVDIISTPESGVGMNDGALQMTFLDGNPPYSIQWSNGSVLNENTNLGSGMYYYTVTDAFGCISVGSGFVDLLNSIFSNKLNQIELFPNPASSSFTLSGIDVIERISIYDALGKEVMCMLNPLASAPVDISSLCEGWYVVKVQSPEAAWSRKLRVE